jgi:hypothetical protein
MGQLRSGGTNMPAVRGILRPALTVTSLVALATASAARADVVIDSFQDRQAGFPLSIHANPDGTSSGILGGTRAYNHVIGGRGISLSIIGASDSDSATVDIEGNSAATFLGYTATSGATASISLEYGTIQDLHDPLGVQASPMELAVAPTSTFLRLTFSTYNHANGQDMEVSALLEFGLSPDSVSDSVSETLSASGPQFLDFPLPATSGNALNSVTFELNAPPGTEFELSSVSLITVPEPGTILLLIPALVSRMKSHKLNRQTSR